MDKLSYKLSDCRIGCLFGDRIINHISYADDFIVFCESVKDLQTLVIKCELYGLEHDINYNQSKTVCMLIKPKKFTLVLSPNILLNGHKLNFVDNYKYLGILVLSSFTDDDDLARQINEVSVYTRKFSCSKFQKLFRCS